MTIREFSSRNFYCFIFYFEIYKFLRSEISVLTFQFLCFT
jgi:hypothetical protein